jgi:hypothetical protein
MRNGLLGPVDEEFEGADLGDRRLEARLLTLVSALDEGPTASLARASKSVAAREAAYRFVENRRVTMEAVMAPHRAKTVARCAEAGTVYVISDTSEFSFRGERRGESLGRLQGKQRGFLGHVAIAVGADGEKRPLGVLGIEIIVRDEAKKAHRNNYAQKRDPKRESLKWASMVDRTEAQLDGVTAIHVMDREGDIFELLSDLMAAKRKFVIRSGQDRWVEGEGQLFNAIIGAPILLERDVKLSRRAKSPIPAIQRRGHPPRTERAARLVIASRSVTLRRPKTTTAEHPAELTVNVVHVHEPSPPEGEPPVDWVLLTSEPVDSAEQVGAVVDAYRARWLIEEFFKALKTGCAFEDRQLRTVQTLTNTLGLLAVIAWRLLHLRWLDRHAPDAPAATALEPILIEALAARLRHIKEPKALPPQPTVADVMRGIARLGGHHKSNGPPGWQLLWAGFHDLLTWGAGFIAGRSITSSDHS